MTYVEANALAVGTRLKEMRGGPTGCVVAVARDYITLEWYRPTSNVFDVIAKKSPLWARMELVNNAA